MTRNRDNEMTLEEARALLRERAEALAAEERAAPEEERGATEEMLVFVIGEDAYAVPTWAVAEAEPLGELTPVPCTPDFVLGVAGLRGRVVCVVDPVRFFGLAGQDGATAGKIVVLSGREMETGFAVDAVPGVRRIDIDALSPGGAGLPASLAGFVRGVTGDPVIVLDAARILAEERLKVNETVD